MSTTIWLYADLHEHGPSRALEGVEGIVLLVDDELLTVHEVRSTCNAAGRQIRRDGREQKQRVASRSSRETRRFGQAAFLTPRIGLIVSGDLRA